MSNQVSSKNRVDKSLGINGTDLSGDQRMALQLKVVALCQEFGKDNVLVSVAEAYKSEAVYIDDTGGNEVRKSIVHNIADIAFNLACCDNINALDTVNSLNAKQLEEMRQLARYLY